jgi:hypothetical protein
MDLVRDDPRAVPGHDVADAFELGAGEDAAPGVVRLGQQQGPGSAREQCVELVEVDLGACAGVR